MQGIQNVLLVAYLLIVLALIAVILLQRSEGGGLGMGSSSTGLMTVRGTANLLTRTTAVLAALFFATAIALTILSSIDHGANDILGSTAAGAVAGAAPQTASGAAASTSPLASSSAAAGTVLDQLTQMQNQTAPVAPAAAPASAAKGGADPTGADQGLALPLSLAEPQVSQAPDGSAASGAPDTAASGAAPDAAATSGLIDTPATVAPPTISDVTASAASAPPESSAPPASASAQ